MSELSILPKRWFTYSVFRQVSLAALAAIGLAASAWAEPPPNDECANAIALTLNEPLFSYTYEATFSGLDSCFDEPSTADVWYKFTAPADGSYRFITNNDIPLHWLALYSECNGSPVRCDNISYLTTKRIDFSMVTNQTVYVRMGTEFGNPFGLLVTPTPPPPSNDECNSPSDLTLGVSIIESREIVEASTASTVPASSCGCNSRGDLWYRLTAPADGTYRIVVHPFAGEGSSTCYVIDSQMNITAYTDCSLTQELSCDVVTEGTVGPATITLALTAGQTVQIRVAQCDVPYYEPLSWDIFADYAIPAPANDSCSQASPIYPDSTIVGSTIGATNDFPPSALLNCTPGAVYNVWHSFTNPYSEARLFEFTVTSDNIAEFSPAITVMDACDGTQLDCATMSSTDPFASRVSGPIDPGQTILIGIAGSGYCIKPTQGIYTITVDAGTPIPPNDDCVNAQPLAPGSFNMSTTLGATSSLSGGLMCEMATNPDVWFSITNTETFPAYFSVDNLGTPIYTEQTFSYYDSCMDFFPIQCRHSFYLPMNVFVQPGNTVLLKVIGIDPLRGDFHINVSAANAYSPPVNDLCTGAISLNTFPFQGSIDAAYQMPTPDIGISCLGIPTTQAGIWYQFTPSTDGDFEFLFSQVDANLLCAVFTGSCETLEEVACRIFGDPTPIQLQGGTSYLILVGHTWGLDFPDQVYFEFNFTPTALPPCPGDFNGNRSVEVADIFAFLNAWFSQFNVCSGAGNCTADINNNGTVEVADIFAFLNQWFGQFGAPCP